MPIDPRAYRLELERIVATRDVLAADALASVTKALETARRDVMDRLASLPASEDGTWTAYQLRQARKSIEGAMDDLRIPLSDALVNGATDAYALGYGSTLQALQAAGLESVYGQIALGRMTGVQAAIIAQHYPKLVKNVTERATDMMGRKIQEGMLTGRGSAVIMGDIRRFLDVPERNQKKFGGLYYQTERVVTTEVNRIYAMASEVGQAATVDRLEKAGVARDTWMTFWLHSGGGRYPRDMHIKLHGSSVPRDGGMFDVNGNPAPYPKAPVLPAGEVVFCRCGSALWSRAWGSFDEAAGWPPGSDAEGGRGAWAA